MAGLVRFSEAISSSVSDCLLNSLRIRSAIAGSSRSSARSDIVVVVVRLTGVSLMLSRPRTGGPKQLRRRDGTLAEDMWLRSGEVQHGRRGAPGCCPAVEDRHHARERR